MSKTTTTTKLLNVGKNMEKLELSNIVGDSAKWYNHFENYLVVSPNVKLTSIL